MQIKVLFIVACFFSSVSAFAAGYRDSVGIENNGGLEVIIHKTDPKDNYYSIGRKYGVAPKTIIEYNGNKTLQIGVLVKVPTLRAFIDATKKTATLKDSGLPLINYKVGVKETLYGIAKRFDTTVEDIKELNKLAGNSLIIGQTIKVRQGMPPKPIVITSGTVVAASESTAVVHEQMVIKADSASTDPEERLKYAANRYGLRQQNEHGVAVWMDDESIDASKMLVLHRTAPVGTVIKITNPMTQKTTFAKVVGKFTENEATKDVIIVVTKAAADLLGVLDKRFQVNIIYGVPNEY